MTRSQNRPNRAQLAVIAGAIGIGGLILGTGVGVQLAPEPTRTCAEWIGPVEANHPWNVCNVDTGSLDPLTTERLTLDEFRQRQTDVSQAWEDALSGGFDDNAGNLEPGKKPCEDWASEFEDDADAVCLLSDIWPDTPLYESEYLVFSEYAAESKRCLEVFGSAEEPYTADEIACEEYYYDTPELEEMR